MLIVLVLTGIGFGLYRFIAGLGATTNLDQQHPWGLWIAMDVGSGIALAQLQGMRRASHDVQRCAGSG